MPELDKHAAPPLEAVLTDAVQRLHEELARLRSAIDELRDELQFAVAVQSCLPRTDPPLRITSLPKDPAAANFFDRINAVSAEQIEAMREEVAQAARRRTAGESA